METTAASAGAARTMKRFYPQWTAENMAAPSIPASSEPIQGADDAGFIEFVLSSNWIMRPDGLRELYAKIREHIPVCSPFLTPFQYYLKPCVCDIGAGVYFFCCTDSQHRHPRSHTNRTLDVFESDAGMVAKNRL